MSTAFVLESDELAGSDAVTFPGFPGVWTPGRPIEADAFVAIGVFVSAAEMEDRVAELGLPLFVTSVEPGSAPMPERDNHAPTLEERVEAVVEEKAGGTISTHDEADAVALELGFVFATDPRPRVVDKVSAIEAIKAGEPQTLATPIVLEPPVLEPPNEGGAE